MIGIAAAAAKIHLETNRIIPTPLFWRRTGPFANYLNHKPFMVQTIRQAIDVPLVFARYRRDIQPYARAKTRRRGND
jgi:hypothetical protein